MKNGASSIKNNFERKKVEFQLENLILVASNEDGI